MFSSLQGSFIYFTTAGDEAHARGEFLTLGALSKAATALGL